jgi:hypothetical protein
MTMRSAGAGLRVTSLSLLRAFEMPWPRAQKWNRGHRVKQGISVGEDNQKLGFIDPLKEETFPW